jgi:hypothetical protein
MFMQGLIFVILEAGHREVFEKSSFGEAFLVVYDRAENCELKDTSAIFRSWFNGNASGDQLSIRRGSGHGDLISNRGTFDSLASAIDTILGTSSSPRFVDPTDTCFSFSADFRCPICNQFNTINETISGFWSLLGEKQVTSAFYNKRCRIRQCEACNHEVRIEADVTNAPKLFAVELTGAPTPYGISAEFELEQQISLADGTFYELCSIMYSQNKNHFNCDAIRSFRTDSRVWCSIDDMIGPITSLASAPTSEVYLP